MTLPDVKVLSKDTETKVLSCLYKVNQFADTVAEHIDYRTFSMDIDKNIAKIAIDQYKQHRCLATEYIFGHEFKKLIKNKILKEDESQAYIERFIEIIKEDVSDWEYVLDTQLIPFLKQRAYKRLVEEMVGGLLSKEKFDEIEKRFDYIKNIGIIEQTTVVETWSEEAIQKRFDDRIREIELVKQGCARIPYGIPKLDEISNGGINTETDRLIVFAAPPKVGKTMSLIHFAKTAAENGFNVAYFTYETAVAVLQDRIDASSSGVKIYDILKKLEEVKNFTSSRKIEGEIYFYKYPTGSVNASTVKRDVMRCEQRTGKKIHLIIVDYLDIGKKNDNIKDENDKDTENWHSYRRVGEELGLPIISATQISAKAGDKSIITSDKVLGSTGKLAAVDALFIVSGTAKDIAQGKIYISSSTCRTIRKTVFSIKGDYEYGKFFTAMDQDEIF